MGKVESLAILYGNLVKAVTINKALGTLVCLSIDTEMLKLL